MGGAATSAPAGETFPDYLAVNEGLGAAVTDGAMFAVLAVTLFAQLRTRSHTPWLYWLTMVLVSIVGSAVALGGWLLLRRPLIALTRWLRELPGVRRVFGEYEGPATQAALAA